MKSNFRSFWMGGFAALGLLALIAASPLQMSERSVCTENLATSSSTTATQFFAGADCLDDGFTKERCIKNMGTTAGFKIFVATFSTVDDTKGWPIFEKQEDCRYEKGSPVYVFHEDGGTGVSVRGRLSK